MKKLSVRFLPGGLLLLLLIGSSLKSAAHSKPTNTLDQKDQKQTFIINNCISDLNEFKKLVNAASPLKKFGTVQINIATLADKSFYEIPEGGNPWNEYASNNATLYKFFPDPKIAPFVPAEFVSKNRQLLMDKAKILRENGMEAAFFANEPGFLPSAFFEMYPQFRGPRVDHPRRSNLACFSPCLSVKEMQEIYTGMTTELLKNAPEVKSFYFKTNDAGSGNCWSDWLYTGPNGPDCCKDETTGDRIQKLMNAMKTGADKAGSKMDIYLSFPQGSSNFSDAERNDIQKKLPDNCYFKSTPVHEIKSIGTSFSSMYPVTGICDVLSLINDLNRIDIQKQQTIFISFNAYYNRGNEGFEVEELLLNMLEDHLLNNTVKNATPSERLHGYCVSWAGKEGADNLYDALLMLNDAFKFRSSNLGNISGINWNVAGRMINRPLVAIPQRLSKEEESYFLPYIFNVSSDEARMDYIDIQGGRWTTSPDSIKSYLKKIKQICAKLESIKPSARNRDFIQNLPVALKMHASMVRSCGNFAEAQRIRDNNKEKLNSAIHRPDKEASWTGDIDLLKFNAVMRDELDNTWELTDVLEQGGINLLCLAKDNAHEDCFLLSPEIIAQLKNKQKIMLAHWRDIEGYMTTPFK
jgi:hypothetical protein